MTSPAQPHLRPELDSLGLERLAALQQQVHSRQSILHYTHAAISTLLAMVFAGAAAKMAYDSTELPYTAAVCALAGGLFLYAVARYLLGRRATVFELRLFEELQVLRKHMGYDEPASLLPR